MTLRIERCQTLVTIAVTLAAIACGACNREPRKEPAVVATAESPVTVTEKWRAKHESDYRREWVSIAGLHKLKPGSNTAGSAARNDVVLPAVAPAQVGTFVLAEDSVRFEPADGADVSLNDKPVTLVITLRQDNQPKADELVVGDIRLVVHVSGENRSIRVRDPNGPLARGFLGFSWFPIDLQYRVVGRFIKDAAPQKIKVLNTFNELDEYNSEGVVEFTMLGQTLRLRPFTTRPKRFYFVFRDASSGQETYEAARFLYADLLDDGTTVLDFNQAYNPPCAFNPYTTCPIPVRENRLPIKILAGEKAYPVHVPFGGETPR
jgi:uncharacterized protein